jgi:hypothetical protein
LSCSSLQMNWWDEYYESWMLVIIKCDDIDNNEPVKSHS